MTTDVDRRLPPTLRKCLVLKVAAKLSKVAIPIDYRPVRHLQKRGLLTEGSSPVATEAGKKLVLGEFRDELREELRRLVDSDQRRIESLMSEVRFKRQRSAALGSLLALLDIGEGS